MDELLAETAARLDAMGAQLAVIVDGELTDAVTGVANAELGTPVTPDTLFQIGSTAKLHTAALVLGLADAGLVDLDRPVIGYLPEVRFPGAEVLTPRHLLSMTSGLDNGPYVHTGRGDDAVERLVALLSGTPQLFPPGAMWSYNNAGYCVLGRIVEVLRGMPYGTALRTDLAVPLGLHHIATCADEAILYGTAVGHAAGEPVPVWSLMRSNEPAGSSLAMRARDLLAFARMHLRGGLAEDGRRVLPEDLVMSMREPQAGLPDLCRPSSWGLGWELQEWEGGVVAGHDGSTPGQAAFLRTVPEAGVAAVLLTNGGDPGPLVSGLLQPVIEEVAGVGAPVPPVPRPSLSPSIQPATPAVTSPTWSPER